MSAALSDQVRELSFRPALRTDLQFRQGDMPGVVLVVDPVRGRRWNLNEIEYRIAHEMTGRHDIRELTQLVQHTLPLATESQIHQLAIKCADMGLLSNVTSDAPMAPVIPLPIPQPPTVAARPARGRPAPIGDDLDDGPTMLTNSSELDAMMEGPDFDDMLSGGTDVVSPTAFEDQVISSSPRDPGMGARPEQAPPAPPVAPPPAPVAPAAAPVITTPVPGTITTPVPGTVTTPAPAGKDPGWEVVKPAWHKSKRARRWLVVGGVLLVFFVVGLIPYPLYVTEPCMVSPIDRAEVRAQISGIIAEVFVREGDAVEIGTQLARLDDRDLTYSLRQAQAEADRYTANLAKVRGGSRPEEIRRAQALVSAKAQDVKFAEIEAKRQQKLFNQGVASAMARDEARRDLGVKRGALSEAQAELRLVKAGSRSEEVDVAEAELRKVEAEIDFLKKQMDNLIIRSPIEGRVLTPRFHERLHARLNPGDTVCEIGNGETVRVDIFVPESDADIIRVGHPVSVKVKSYPLESFDGRVSHIAPAVEDVEGQRVIRVETVLDNDQGLLRPRMSGFAEIDTGKRPIAVRVFRRAVRWLRVRFLL